MPGFRRSISTKTPRRSSGRFETTPSTEALRSPASSSITPQDATTLGRSTASSYVVLVWRYDRFARSTHALINALTEFHALGVDFISLQEGTDTTTAQGKLVFTIMAGLAEFESALISERVIAGMERARADGKHIGRPPLDPKMIDQMQELRRQGRSYSDIQKACRGVGRSTVVKHTRGVKPDPRSRRSGATN